MNGVCLSTSVDCTQTNGPVGQIYDIGSGERERRSGVWVGWRGLIVSPRLPKAAETVEEPLGAARALIPTTEIVIEMVVVL